MKVLTVLLALWPLLVSAQGWNSRPLSTIALHPEFRAPAAVHPREEASLAAEVAARVVALPVRAGETAGRGAELARLDDAAYRIERERGRAQLVLVERRIGLARAQLEQARALAARGFISADGLRIRETELGVLQSERAAAAAALAGAELALARCVIRAPFDGVVRARLAAVGDLAAPGTPLLRFTASADAEVRAQVPAARIDSLLAASGWTFDAGGGSHALRLLRVSPLLEAAGQVREAVFAAAAALPPGLAGELRWRSARPHLPPAYVQQRDGVLGAWVERDGRPVFVALPEAQAGRPVAVDWPPATALIDEGRFALERAAPAVKAAP
ncbi:efflux RND transporter periplasmic adaptor subunit [Thauera aromatica]|uniref:RND family multidrug efflux pump membrane fusion protein n=1 Tax=Thauera aromatica K172 TaxID=44139 RepID=A0A2R4BK87_THAAR|nr:efflux RND transporter periplasmic adaptor subunit [Thauera aromatica]AVR87719.1 RND family multidrug efflux pump membrane fusion protein [Thauera aromatica K172]